MTLVRFQHMNPARCHRTARFLSNESMQDRTYLSHRAAKTDPARGTVVAALELIDRDLAAAGVFLPSTLCAGTMTPRLHDVYAARTVARLVQAVLRAA